MAGVEVRPGGFCLASFDCAGTEFSSLGILMEKKIMEKYHLPKHTGFTLVELLVVIAVIALLLSILMPSLKKAREQARTLVCSSDQKQFGVGMQMYVNTYDLYPPLLFYPAQYPPKEGLFLCVTGAYYVTWESMLIFSGLIPEALSDYQGTIKKSPNIWRCPSEQHPYKNGVWRPAPPFRHYGINGYLSAIDPARDYRKGHKESKIHNPSGTILFSEVDADQPYGWFWPGVVVNPKSYQKNTIFRHNNRTVVAFFDGHVGRIRSDDEDYNTSNSHYWLLER